MINQVILRAGSGGVWWQFSQPYRIIQTRNPDAVCDSLREVEAQLAARHCYAAGFIAYEAAVAFDAAQQSYPPGDFPLLWFGLYSAPKQITLPNPMPTPTARPNWRLTVDEAVYAAVIARIRAYIRAGDTYQVNYTLRQRAAYTDDAWPLFLALRGDAPYAAYIETEDYAICSASPELFFEQHGQQLRSRPMKGTAARGMTLEQDRQQAAALQVSAKDRAENLMIVDMIRNDLSRIARLGSVQVPQLFALEKYATVWQMTSTVTACTDASVSEVMQALFPCASITGAPKVQTMKIVTELEDSPRNIYTGTIGYIAPQRQARFNVAIRTVLVDKRRGQAEYGVGSGIVWDSVDCREYQECLSKSLILRRTPAADFALLETLLWTPEGGFFLLQEHLDRLQATAKYFDYRFDRRVLCAQLRHLAEDLPPQPYKIRVLLAQQGSLRIDHVALSSVGTGLPLKITLNNREIDEQDPFLYHKTTRRQVYNDALTAQPDYDEVLLWNRQQEVTEACTANVVIPLGDRLLTPPVRCGLLDGTYRRWLLARGEIKEQRIPLGDLRNGQLLYLINSVRKWRAAHLYL